MSNEILEIRRREGGWEILAGWRGEQKPENEMWMPLADFEPAQPEYCVWRFKED